MAELEDCRRDSLESLSTIDEDNANVGGEPEDVEVSAADFTKMDREALLGQITELRAAVAARDGKIEDLQYYVDTFKSKMLKMKSWHRQFASPPCEQPGHLSATTACNSDLFSTAASIKDLLRRKLNCEPKMSVSFLKDDRYYTSHEVGSNIIAFGFDCSSKGYDVSPLYYDTAKSEWVDMKEAWIEHDLYNLRSLISIEVQRLEGIFVVRSFDWHKGWYDRFEI